MSNLVNYNEIVDELKILKFLWQQLEKFQNFHFVDARKKRQTQYG